MVLVSERKAQIVKESWWNQRKEIKKERKDQTSKSVKFCISLFLLLLILEKIKDPNFCDNVRSKGSPCGADLIWALTLYLYLEHSDYLIPISRNSFPHGSQLKWLEMKKRLLWGNFQFPSCLLLYSWSVPLMWTAKDSNQYIFVKCYSMIING